MPNFTHCGLYFTPDHIHDAQKYRDRAPLSEAWPLLEPDAERLAALQRDALRWRFLDDHVAGERAARGLSDGFGMSANDDAADYREQLAETITLAQCFEMLRDYSTFSAQNEWLNHFASRVDDLNHPPYAMMHVERLWLGLLNLAAGVVLEDETRLEAGAEVYQQTIQNDVRPEGYIPLAVDGKDGGSFQRQMLSVKALVLMAEAASHVDLDLWGYTARGVSVTTASAYLIYYFYYPEQWRWDALEPDEAKALFRQEGGWLEILNRHARPKDLKLVLDELRPINDVTGGGLTTLTHAVPAKRGLFG